MRVLIVQPTNKLFGIIRPKHLNSVDLLTLARGMFQLHEPDPEIDQLVQKYKKLFNKTTSFFIDLMEKVNAIKC